jgi:hypothetical protein
MSDYTTPHQQQIHDNKPVFEWTWIHHSPPLFALCEACEQGRLGRGSLFSILPRRLKQRDDIPRGLVGLQVIGRR